MNKALFLTLTIILLFSAPSPAANNVVVIPLQGNSGGIFLENRLIDTTGDPTWNRPYLVGETCYLSGVTTAVPYEYFRIEVLKTGQYIFEAGWDFNGYLLLYHKVEPPDFEICTGLVATSSTYMGSVNRSRIEYTLQKGNIYGIVATGYTNADDGFGVITIAGPQDGFVSYFP